jgi:DNA-directed RNA polymerase, mitochondrial
MNGPIITPLYQRQLDLEIESAGMGAERFRHRRDKAVTKGQGDATTPGRFIIRRAIEPLSDGMTEYVGEAMGGRPGPRPVAAKLLKDMDHDVAAFVVIRTVVQKLMQRGYVPLLVLAYDVGGALEAEARFREFQETAPALFATVSSNLNRDGASEFHRQVVLTYAMGKFDIPWNRWSRNDRIHLGANCLDLLQKYTGIITINQIGAAGLTNGKERQKNRRHPDTHIVSIEPKHLDWITQSFAKGEGLANTRMPMIHPPKAWDYSFTGGYLSKMERPMPLIRQAHRGQKKALEKAGLHAVFSGLNALQETRWQINRPILETMDVLSKMNIPVAGLVPPKDADLPYQPADIATNPDALRKWKWAARDVHRANAKSRQQRVKQEAFLDEAKRFLDEEAIYFPHSLDFRGRAYPMPVNIHPQGEDMVRAILKFADPKPLGERGKFWLAVHGANCFGVDKVSFEERVAWVEAHHFRIKSCYLDPLMDRWWTQADNPWQFLAFCIEWGSMWEGVGYFWEKPEDFPSSIPVALDGSCNGLQHFSAMLLDSNGGAAVNLLPADKPQDIYQKVADQVIERFTVMSKNEALGKEADWAYGWIQFGINRKITKRPVMVLPYGGTIRSCVKYVREAVEERIAGGQKHNFGDDLSDALGFLAKTVWSAIGDVILAARKAMEWLQGTARVLTKAGHPIRWTTPSGFIVHQQYHEQVSSRIKLLMSGSRVDIRVTNEGPELAKSKQANSVSPNFVHSLDAAAMIMTVDRLHGMGLRHFAMVHDSYAVHACDTDTLAEVLRETFIRMYETDPLTQFRDEVISMYPDVADDLKPLPKKGTLNLWQIMSADFFFA